MVIAAASVTSDPSSGIAARQSQAVATGRRRQHGRQQIDAADDRRQDRPRRGHDHHHEDEQRLGVVARLGIGERIPAPGHHHHRQHQHDAPEAEHDLDLAEQVKEPGVAREAARQPHELLDAEGVRESEKEGRGDELEGAIGGRHWRREGRHGYDRAAAAVDAEHLPVSGRGAGRTTPPRRPRRRAEAAEGPLLGCARRVGFSVCAAPDAARESGPAHALTRMLARQRAAGCRCAVHRRLPAAYAGVRVSWNAAMTDVDVLAPAARPPHSRGGARARAAHAQTSPRANGPALFVVASGPKRCSSASMPPSLGRGGAGGDRRRVSEVAGHGRGRQAAISCAASSVAAPRAHKGDVGAGGANCGDGAADAAAAAGDGRACR
jgi:hypothetical protein